MTITCASPICHEGTPEPPGAAPQTTRLSTLSAFPRRRQNNLHQEDFQNSQDCRGGDKITLIKRTFRTIRIPEEETK
jgi:hypothetical protein